MTRIEYSLRPATGADAPRVTALADAAYGHYVERIGMLPRPMTDDYAEVIENGSNPTQLRRSSSLPPKSYPPA